MSEVLVFEIGGRSHAVAAERVREVAPLGPLTPIPTASPIVAGVTQVRGQILPVLDLEPTEPAPAALRRLLVVVEDREVRAAIRVDRVVGVQSGVDAADSVDLSELFGRSQAS